MRVISRVHASCRLVPPLIVNSDEIHVWALSLHAAREDFTRLNMLLSTDEQERRDRYRFNHLKRSYAICRGALRHLLSLYTESPATGIRFAYGLNGKPALAEETGLQFNISHSDGLAAFAFTSNAEIGVDIERIRFLEDRDAIANRFSDGEFSDLMSLPTELRDFAFFRCWTRKEAFLKGLGSGLAATLDGFRVTLRPNEPARLLATDKNGDPPDWTLEDLQLADGYMAALAYNGPRRRVRVFRMGTALPESDTCARFCSNFGR